MFNFFGFFGDKNKKETALIFDIGSGSVAGALLEFSPQKNPKILYSRREDIKFQKNLQGARFKKEMYKSLGLVLEDLRKNILANSGHLRVFRRALCSLASPWFISETDFIKIEKEKPFLVTEEFLSKNILEAEKRFEDSSLAKYGSDRKQESEIIEKKIVDIRLNGYKTDEPLGKESQSVELSVFLSMSQKSVLDDIEDLVLEFFHLENLAYHSFGLVSFSAARDMYDRVSNFLLLDITGEVTDVSLIREKNIVKTISFPQGKNSVIRGLAKDLKIESGEAHSKLRLLFSSSLKKPNEEALRKKIEKHRSLWLQEFQKSLDFLSDGLSLPSTIFFTADDDFSSWYGEVIKSEKYAEHTMTEGSFIVSFINSSSLGSFVEFESNKKDTFLGIISLFFKKVFELNG
ncbi:hypothetical protein COV42_00745 [Candidatus Campbellbacteria bacterium CG11_big_fil_rev_8_21_14_0_20_44_21]|uniref:SHS2 domain-containing protein n=1 Tax=Candidatus Campbellbacteria bacterium CG22_combo_CG10-13_8_21_14_all_43_18 TaxID=1974530 RepID=A0A2H0DXL8_9BACT|nr:MAG: hypothetical protein COW82_00400 [Candidatus Campbellbacteria bacterium CG22_combo_CG10-13_8_21_14_all_43_18]PIR24433.1 MAG: hypothetical protein COV42_00745 [Candidatus Campbellbacteria bacterium CG11_big_fil_rev_8_21_14_0_20_44_21]